MAVSRRFAAVVLLCALCLPAPWVAAQEDSSSEKLSKESQTVADQREQRIRKELATLSNHPWAGEYYFGDGLGVNVRLVIAPKAGFIFTWHGCLGLYDLNYGEVEEGGGRIRLGFKYSNSRVGFQGLAPELIPVRWGARHYLIPADGMIEFTNAVNAGLEPSTLFGGRSGRFLLKDGDEKKKVSGRPGIPAAYAQYLLDKPIRGTITAVGESRIVDEDRLSIVTLDVGSDDGLKLGMELHVYSPADIVESVTLTKVSQHSSEATMVQVLVEDKPPSVGWKVSTKFR